MIKRRIEELHELVALQGSFTSREGDWVNAHLHVVLALRPETCEAIRGFRFAGTVDSSLELFICKDG